MKKKHRLALWATVILLLALAIWLAVEFSPRSFEAITGLDKEEVEFIWTYDSQGHRTEDAEDINSLVEFLSGYRYQRILASSFDFVEQFPGGLAAFSIFIHVGEKEFTFVEPLVGWANIDNKLYRVLDGPLDMDWLWQWLEGLPPDPLAEQSPELPPLEKTPPDEPPQTSVQLTYTQLEQAPGFAEVIRERQELSAASDHNADYDRGVLYDLDGDGRAELLLYFHEDEADSPWLSSMYGQVWREDEQGKAELLLDMEIGFLAGAPVGGLSLVELDGMAYLCSWCYSLDGSAPEESASSWERYRLYQWEDDRLESAASYEFRYRVYGREQFIIDEEDAERQLYLDGQEISFADFQTARIALYDQALHLVNSSFAPAPAGQPLPELLARL